jgi:MFS family permease
VRKDVKNVCLPVCHKDVKMKSGNIWFMSLVAAMGGFLFGYDTAVINGAEQQIQSGWSLSSLLHGWVMSAALWGTVAGALCGGKVTDRFGRKWTLFGVGVLYLVSAVWSAAASGPYALMAARFIGGLGVGASSIAAPVYIAEISPAASRGRMTALFQLNIVLGMVASQVVNWGLGGLGENAWRWMLGAEAVPALLFVVLCPFLAESPRWRAGATGRTIARPEGTRFFVRSNLKPIVLAFAIAMFNQLSGINAVLYFARRIFEMAGCSSSGALAVAAGLTAVNGAGTFLGLALIDRLGRRTLLVIGGIGYIVSLFACSAAFLLGMGPVAAACIFLFIVSHALGQGTVIWVFIAEIFPQELRAEGQALGSFTHWLFAAILTFAFPLMVANLAPGVIFGLFGAMMVLHLLWAIFLVPETKGRRLEEIRL